MQIFKQNKAHALWHSISFMSLPIQKIWSDQDLGPFKLKPLGSAVALGAPLLFVLDLTLSVQSVRSNASLDYPSPNKKLIKFTFKLIFIN